MKELPDSSQDKESDNIIKRYQQRPKQLEKFCLADFAAWFECVKDTENDTNSSESSLTGSGYFLPEANFEENTDDDPKDTNITGPQCEINEYKLKGGMKLVIERRLKLSDMPGTIKIRTQKNIAESNLCFIHRGGRKT